MGCAECHDHKFDPYTQEDFYSLAAFFADVDWSGNYKGLGTDVTPTQRPPEMLAWTLPVYERLQEVDAKIAELEASLVGTLASGWEKRRDELVQLKRERLELEVAIRADDDHQGRGAARDSRLAARQLDGYVGQGRSAADAALHGAS